MTWDIYHQGVAEALGAPPPTYVHIPSDSLVKIAPQRAASVADNFQFNNIFDNTAAHNELGFRYTIPWVAGVKRIVEWLERNVKPSKPMDIGIDDQIINAWQKMEAGLVSELGNL